MFQAFEGFGPMLKNPRYLVGGDEDIVKAEHGQRDFARTGSDLKCRFKYDRQRALRSGQRPPRMESVFRQQPVEVVARNAARNFRIAAADGIAEPIPNRDQPRIKLALAPA